MTMAYLDYPAMVPSEKGDHGLFRLSYYAISVTGDNGLFKLSCYGPSGIDYHGLFRLSCYGSLRNR
jgi:hypothetical protein